MRTPKAEPIASTPKLWLTWAHLGGEPQRTYKSAPTGLVCGSAIKRVFYLAGWPSVIRLHFYRRPAKGRMRLVLRRARHQPLQYGVSRARQQPIYGHFWSSFRRWLVAALALPVGGKFARTVYMTIEIEEALDDAESD